MALSTLNKVTGETLSRMQKAHCTKGFDPRGKLLAGQRCGRGLGWAVHDIADAGR